MEAYGAVQIQVAEEFELVTEIEKNPAQALIKVLHLDIQKELSNSTCSENSK